MVRALPANRPSSSMLTRASLLVLATLVVSCVLPRVAREPKPSAAADAGTALPPTFADPRDDPANRYEDLATFQSLLPKAHLFAEWLMPDTAPAAAHSYGVSGNVVTDSVTKLRWQRALPATYPGCSGRHQVASKLYEEGSGCSWEQAQKYCASAELADSLGPGVWRLPTRIELESLLDYDRTPTIPEILESDQDDFYWTSSPAPNPEGVKLSWAVDFMDGYSYMTRRFKAGRVRCVSSAEASGGAQPNYEIQQKTVVDWTTHLTWQRSADSATRSWEEARAYCDSLGIDRPGWRLPALKELLTIVDARRYAPAIEARAFEFTQSDRFWTATVYGYDAAQAYSVEFLKGESQYSDKSDKHYVRCVR